VRYEKQYEVIQQIMEIYDKGSDSEEENKKIVDLMQQVILFELFAHPLNLRLLSN
jgi:hypothetical protein